MKKLLPTIEHHIGVIQNKMCIMPDLIDVTNDKVLWDMMFTCNFIFVELIEDYVLDHKGITILVSDYNGYLMIIDDMIVDKSKYFLVNVYFILMLEYMNEYCIENELYESCANIKNFNELL
jgi:hypothetical protein